MKNLKMVATMAIFLSALLMASSAMAALPTVAVMPLDTSEAGRLAYTGPAVQQMLISRLASEKLDVIPARQASDTALTDEESSADFTITGKIIAESQDNIRVDLVLHSRGNESPAASWEIKPASLGSLVKETGKYSIIIAQKISNIENQKTILSAFNETSSSVEESDQPIIDNEQLRLARIHPDKLYRETPVGQKGTASPIDQIPEGEEESTKEETPETQTTENNAQQNASGTEKFLRNELPPPESKASDEEDDNWEPDYPPVYDDDLARKMKEEERQERAQRSDNGESEDLSLDYPPEYDETSPTVAPPSHRAASQAPSSAEKEEKSWWSYLWPFGGHEEKREMPKPVKPDRLPYPVPVDIDKSNTAESGTAAPGESFSVASIPPSTGIYGAGTPETPAATETPEEPGMSESGAAQPEQAGTAGEQDRELMHLYNSMADSVEGEPEENAEPSDNAEEGAEESGTENTVSDVTSSFFNATEAAGSAATEGASDQDSSDQTSPGPEAAGSEMENAEVNVETEEAGQGVAPAVEAEEEEAPAEEPSMEKYAEQPQEEQEEQTEAVIEEQTPEEQGIEPEQAEAETAPAQAAVEQAEEAEEQIEKQALEEPEDQAGTEEEKPENAKPSDETGQQSNIQQAENVQHARPQPAYTKPRKSRIGWFSWLWPDSWKGGGGEAASHTATVKPAVNEEEMEKEPPYHAASEPPVGKNSRKGPIWVWN